MVSPSANSPMLVDTALLAKFIVDAGVLTSVADSRELFVARLDFDENVDHPTEDCTKRSHYLGEG
jgi:hypothetical protein